MKIAVVGSGISGLAAAWYLGQDHQVTVCERGRYIGLDAHSVEVEATGSRVHLNAPMRVFYEGYYPTLSELYRDIGVAYESVNYSASFSPYGHRAYFRYKNYWLGRITLPFLAGPSLRTAGAWGLGLEIALFLRRLRQLDLHSIPDSMTFEDYLERSGCSKRLVQDFLYPAMAGICTCSYQSVADYPAAIMLGYLARDLTWSRVNRLTHGVQDVACRLSAAADDIQLGLDVKYIVANEDKVELHDGRGYRERFDHVVVATQANQARSLLPEAMAAERSVLASFDYEGSRLQIHNDQRLAPVDQRDWAPVNFLLSQAHRKPMASIWLNAIYPELTDAAPMFETWNPFTEVDHEHVMVDAWVERPVVTARSLNAIEQLERLQAQEDRRVWFCGSYAYRGIPLLESAVASGKDIAQKITGLNRRVQAR